jgi:hypothetical protein
MAVKFPQFDNELLGGSDTWDNDLAGQILLQDYFEPAPATTAYVISDNTGSTYSGTRDGNNWGRSTNNFGTGTTWTIGHWDDSSGADTRRGFLAFDGLSSVPAGTVSNVKIRLYVTDVVTNGTFDFHRITRSWVENQFNWENYSTGNAWTTIGGDFNATVVASKTINSSDVGTYVEISGTALTQLVQDWLDGTFANHGLLIKSPTETGGPAFNTTISAKEGTNGQRPELTFDLAGAASNPTITSAGIAVATFQPKTLSRRTLSSAGISANTFAQKTLARRTVSSTGLSTNTFQPKALARRTFTTAGEGAFNPIRLLSGVTFGISGAATVTFVPKSLARRSLSSNGVGATSLQQRALARRTFSSAGLGVFTAQRKVLFSVTLTTAGIGAGTFTPKTLLKRTFSSTGVGSALWSAVALGSNRTFSSLGTSSVLFLSYGVNRSVLTVSSSAVFNPIGAFGQAGWVEAPNEIGNWTTENGVSTGWTEIPSVTNGWS